MPLGLRRIIPLYSTAWRPFLFAPRARARPAGRPSRAARGIRRSERPSWAHRGGDPSPFPALARSGGAQAGPSTPHRGEPARGPHAPAPCACRPRGGITPTPPRCGRPAAGPWPVGSSGLNGRLLSHGVRIAGGLRHIPAVAQVRSPLATELGWSSLARGLAGGWGTYPPLGREAHGDGACGHRAGASRRGVDGPERAGFMRARGTARGPRRGASQPGRMRRRPRTPGSRPGVSDAPEPGGQEERPAGATRARGCAAAARW